MRDFLYWVVGIFAKVHHSVMTINDSFEYTFNDKELHFLIVGGLGMLLLLLVHPVFRFLAKRGHVMVISWIYVFTLILVITFAIEIGQRATNTGRMEFADIVFGVVGFISMFAVFAVVRGICRLTAKLLRNRKKKGEE